MKNSGLLSKIKRLSSSFKLIKSAEYNQIVFELRSQDDEIRRATEFVKKIDEYNLEAEHEGIEDNTEIAKKPLAVALINMRNRMREYSEKEKERTWSTEGHAMFADILHNTKSDTATISLYDQIISNLVKYLQANQGGLFIVNDEEEENSFIELVACYAYERKKYQQKKIGFGEGLIGQCILERETIYMTEIPSGYTTITSGLGDATPRCLIIIPLKTNDKIFGAVEIASFNEVKVYQKEFIEKLSESIASAISTLKTAGHTQKLLEESKINEEKLRSQEEEMRQNLEELHTTQEQMKRQEEEMIENMQEMAVAMQEDMIKKEQVYLAEIEELKVKLNSIK